MQIETDHSKYTNTGQPLWLAPIAVLCAIIEAIARLFRVHDRLKSCRRHKAKFAANWRDHFDGLRCCEWNRDRMRAMGAAQLLAGQPLDLSSFTADEHAPDHFGGPCPTSPWHMHLRFLALSRFRLDPEADIRRHAKRITKRVRTALMAASPAPVPFTLIVSRPHRGRPPNDAGERRTAVATRARAPPAIAQLPTIAHLAVPTSEIAPSCARLKLRQRRPDIPTRHRAKLLVSPKFSNTDPHGMESRIA